MLVIKIDELEVFASIKPFSFLISQCQTRRTEIEALLQLFHASEIFNSRFINCDEFEECLNRKGTENLFIKDLSILNKYQFKFLCL